MPALVSIQVVQVSVAEPREVTPIFLPLKSCMKAGQGLPAFGESTWLPITSCSTTAMEPPATIFILAPRCTAEFTTSTGDMKDSMLLAIMAWAPSGDAGIICSSHLMPAFSQYPLLMATRIIMLPSPGKSWKRTVSPLPWACATGAHSMAAALAAVATKALNVLFMSYLLVVNETT